MKINTQITFENIETSNPMKNHINDKLKKISRMLKNKYDSTITADFHLKADKKHSHNQAEFNLKTNHFNLHASSKDADMYVAIDIVINKMEDLISKEKSKKTVGSL